MDTKTIPISPWRIGRFEESLEAQGGLPLEDWDITLSETPDARALHEASVHLRDSDVPVAFPTETVYGLGADATRSASVSGIYKAKQRPSDNPLIVHIASLKQLRSLLQTSQHGPESSPASDPIPEIYHPLIAKFWPGPLTILLPLPSAVSSPLAPETTAGLRTFGARMPADLLALSLIKLADRPIAAPSANASTRPSPTAAEHVLNDLHGRIEIILDGGPCAVGVESTVVDGLCDPPCVLRPGGISLGELRRVKGWECAKIAYEDRAGVKSAQGPRAPGMKYRHYSPRTRVHLFEAGTDLRPEHITQRLGKYRTVGVVRTKRWRLPFDSSSLTHDPLDHPVNGICISQAERAATGLDNLPAGSPLSKLLRESSRYDRSPIIEHNIEVAGTRFTIQDVSIGPDTRHIARGLFAVLRDMDKKELDVIIVEGISTDDGDDISAAVMNRLRKAAESEAGAT